MKKFTYTLVTSPRDGQEGDDRQARARTLTLRETLVIDEGPRYSREYTIATDGAGTPCRAEELSVDRGGCVQA